MTESEAGTYWNNNADTWTTLARAGYDIYRDHLNTPAFLKMLPDTSGLHGIDIGCGEGNNTRLIAAACSSMKAIDISEIFIEHARELETASPLGIEYTVASATHIPYSAEQFDFATSFMCMMDIPDAKKAIAEIFRVLKPGGFFQFSITHPCYNPSHRRNLRNLNGVTYAIEVGGYFENANGRIEEWLFSDTPRPLAEKLARFKVPLFNRTLTEWFNDITNAGFTILKINEPRPDDQSVILRPALQDAQVVAYFLHFLCLKPA